MVNSLSNPLDQAIADGTLVSDPYAVYHNLHADFPGVLRSELWGAPVVFRYDLVVAALRDFKRLSNQGRVVNHLKRRFTEEAAGELKPLVEHYSRGLIHSDPPDHTRLRRVIQSTFVPRTLERLRPRVAEIVAAFLDDAASQKKIEFVHGLAFLLPVTVIAELLGIPVEMRGQFKRWSGGVVEFMESPSPEVDCMRRSQSALLELRSYFASIVKQRRSTPGDDLLSLLVEARDGGDSLTDEELLSTCVTLLIGGHETTTSLLTSAIWLIGSHAKVRESLLEDLTRIPTAVEEMLRFEPPFQRILRVALEDLTVGGMPLRAGETVVLLLGAANRDPAQFEQPDLFDITRAPNRHVSFGYGIHHCLGAALARLEVPLALTSFLGRFPDFAVPQQPPEWHDGMVRSIRKLAVELNRN
jgi:hypothetical protein